VGFLFGYITDIYKHKIYNGCMRKKQAIVLVFIISIVLLISSFGMMQIEKVSYEEALYRSFYISLTHHDNFHMESWPARGIIIGLVLSSLVLLAYLLKLFGEYIIGLGDGLKRRKVKAKLLSMKDHYIVCGLGRVGSQVARELASEGQHFVAIDKDEDKVKEAVAMGYTAFVGDPTKEKDLHKAKIEKAKGIVASLGDDSNNLFLTLTARQLNPDLFIVSRANREENVTRIIRAGADKVSMPNQIGGFHMATMLMRPHVIDILDSLSTNKSADLQVKEVSVPKSSRVSGHRLENILKHAEGITILALNTANGNSQVHPTGREVVYPGDRLIVMGTRNQLHSLEKLV
jgi:voltage-gated potassium channel